MLIGIGKNLLKKRFIYINPGFKNHIVGFNAADSSNLLNYLFNFMNKPEFQIRFKWTENTIAMWDNRCAMHYAIGDYMANHRKMHHVTVLNDKKRVVSLKSKHRFSLINKENITFF